MYKCINTLSDYLSHIGGNPMKSNDLAYLITKKEGDGKMVVKAEDKLHAIFCAQEIDPSYSLNTILVKPLGPVDSLTIR